MTTPNNIDPLKLLCQCISPIENTEKIFAEINSSEFDWDPVIYCSGQHLVTPALCFYLKKKELFSFLNNEQKEYLETIYDLNLTRNNKIKAQLLLLLPDLNAAGIEPLLLKGIASLLDELYESPGIRVLGDIDILIPEDKLAVAANIMQEHDYTAPELLYEGVVIEHRHLPSFTHDDQPVAIELHRYPVALKHNGWVNNESAWEGAVSISLKTGTVRLPSAEFRLLHNFCHCQLGDKGYLIGYINARQMFEWVLLRKAYEAEFDWISLNERVEENQSITAWGGWLLAAEHFFSQALPSNTSLPFMARIFIYRDKWRRTYASYYKINHIVTYIFSYIKNALSTLLLNYRRGPKPFFNALWISFKLLASPKWYINQFKRL